MQISLCIVSYRMLCLTRRGHSTGNSALNLEFKHIKYFGIFHCFSTCTQLGYFLQWTHAFLWPPELLITKIVVMIVLS